MNQKAYDRLQASGGDSRSSCAKIGHGKQFGNTRTPKRVEAFYGISIEQVACGEEMTCCLTDEGDVYVFGMNYLGCMGLGLDEELYATLVEDTDCVYKPIKIPYFHVNKIRVKKIACGDSHCIALSENNQIFTWGCGEFGRLGNHQALFSFDNMSLYLI